MSLLPQFDGNGLQAGVNTLNIIDKLRALKANLKNGKNRASYKFTNEFKRKLSQLNLPNVEAKDAQAFLLNPI